MFNFNNKDDKKSCFVHIQSGSGGIDSKSWIIMLLKMYIKWANKKKLSVNLKSEFPINSNKNKYFILNINGDYSYGLFRTEIGIHKLIRKSPFNFFKRHTSFGSVYVYPKDINYINNIKLKSNDIKINCFKSSGAGGQHVNKTKSAVRITHIPTNIISICKSNRSQHLNKHNAINNLKLKLKNMELKKNKLKKKTIDSLKSEISWGNHIRSYILDNSLIKDIRTGIEIRNIKYILNGNIEIFVKKSLELNIN